MKKIKECFQKLVIERLPIWKLLRKNVCGRVMVADAALGRILYRRDTIFGDKL